MNEAPHFYSSLSDTKEARDEVFLIDTSGAWVEDLSSALRGCNTEFTIVTDLRDFKRYTGREDNRSAFFLVLASADDVTAATNIRQWFPKALLVLFTKLVDAELLRLGLQLNVSGLVPLDPQLSKNVHLLMSKLKGEIESSKEAGRLKGVLASYHHRVRNSFQIIKSLLSMDLRAKVNLTQRDLRRVSAHVQSLSTMQDIIKEQGESCQEPAVIEVSDLLQRILKGMGGLKKGLQLEVHTVDAKITPKTASSLAVIITEVVFNSMSLCTQTVKIELLVDVEEGGILVVTDDRVSDLDEDDAAPKAQSLVDFLARADFKKEVLYSSESQRFEVRVRFPLFVKLSDSSSSDGSATSSEASVGG